MQEFEIRRGHFKKLEGDRLKTLMQESFGNVTPVGDTLVSRFGAMDPITVQLKGKNLLAVEVVTKKDVEDKAILGTIRAKNTFLESATGYSAKERAKRLQKKAKESAL